jgi:hypothetical protein
MSGTVTSHFHMLSCRARGQLYVYLKTKPTMYCYKHEQTSLTTAYYMKQSAAQELLHTFMVDVVTATGLYRQRLL